MLVEPYGNRAPLTAQMGITESQIERRLRLVGFMPDDVKRVTALTDIVVSHLDELTSAFFEYLAAVEEAAGLVQNVALMDTVRQLKTEHLRAMVSGAYGLDYVEDRLKLGMLYAKAGLDPRVFLGAFHHLMRTIGFRVMECHVGNPIEGFDRFMAFKKVAFFDLSLIVDVIVFEREQTIALLQQQALRELSTPVLQVRDRLLILPIIGTVDAQRARQLTDSLLAAITTRRAKVVVLDITGVTVVDSAVANHLKETVLAAQLMGAATVLTGLSTEVAQAMATLGVAFDSVHIVGDLQGGIEEAERLLGGLTAGNGTSGRLALSN
jgi:rsbT co-antagonist protein RsbR